MCKNRHRLICRSQASPLSRVENLEVNLYTISTCSREYTTEFYKFACELQNCCWPKHPSEVKMNQPLTEALKTVINAEIKLESIDSFNTLPIPKNHDRFRFLAILVAGPQFRICSQCYSRTLLDISFKNLKVQSFNFQILRYKYRNINLSH